MSARRVLAENKAVLTSLEASASAGPFDSSFLAYAGEIMGGTLEYTGFTDGFTEINMSSSGLGPEGFTLVFDGQPIAHVTSQGVVTKR